MRMRKYMQHWEHWLLLALLLALPACGLVGDDPAPEPALLTSPVVTLETSTLEAQAAPLVDTADWLDASVPGMTFGGSLLYFCRGISVTQARSAAPEVREAVVAWPEGASAAGLLAVGELRWPAPSQTLADLETLANAGLQADLCSSYADFWPESLALPAPEAYLTALARLVEEEWQVRIALVQD